MSALISVPQSTRRHDLDWLRVLAFGALIFYHIGMFYVTWGWHVKSDHASPFLEPAMSLLNPWRLALLFFISGVALRFAADARGFRALLPERSARLFVPLAFGMLVLVVPQAYFELCYKGEFRGSIVDFYPRYLGIGEGFSIITPTWNHLWYVAYVLVYTFLLAGAAAENRRTQFRRRGNRLAGAPSCLDPSHCCAVRILFALAQPSLPHHPCNGR
ncbi:MAG: acyltransferase family protein [Neoaquamicrobium sediminum]